MSTTQVSSDDDSVESESADDSDATKSCVRQTATNDDSSNESDHPDSRGPEAAQLERELRRRLKQEYDIDSNNKRCSCGSTDVTHVLKVNAPTTYNLYYECSECADDCGGVYATLIPVEYAQASLTRGHNYEYMTVYDKRGRMNGSEYA